ncbi:MAG TPA: FAD-linked oxidase C-terminal domain-containing protein [Pyrinomonadaceae bacterium]
MGKTSLDTLIKNLSAIVGSDHVLSTPDELLVYECDGLPHHKHRPRAVVFPSSTAETAAVMKELALAQVPFTPRGAGTGLSGGALALNQGVVIELARMRKILKVDVPNRLAVVQPGVVNLHVSRAVAPFGLYYVPDPSSQPTCTIGGNIAESAGGIHCLKYGTTTDHVLGCRVVLAGGEVVDLGGSGIEIGGYDLLGTFIGSEGTFGIATEATLRLSQTPPAVRTLLAEFGEVNDASHAVSAIIAAGVMPAALEMMDREIIRAIEASIFAAGLPPDAGAALLIELDGIEAGIDDEVARVTDICMEFGARNCRAARDENDRKKLWAARKGAFGAIGRVTPDTMIQDAVVPRSRLPEVLSAAYEIAGRHRLRMANVFHAGDGNLHPLICFDSRFPDEVKRVREAGSELMQVCVSAGGTITGEHGVGLDKRELLPLVFSDVDMNCMLRVRSAFDPLGLCNPGKVVPMLRGCGEGRAVSFDLSNANSVVSETFERARSTMTGKMTPKVFDVEAAANKIEAMLGAQNLVQSESIVVHPGSVAEIIEVMKLASSEAWTVRPAGSMSWLGVKTPANLIVSMSRLNQIIEHEPADLIAIAQAGVRLTTFNEELSKNGQRLPLDPPDDGRATLGGVVATGLGGAQQVAYGRPRRSVIGMKVVLADGSLVKAGGRVVKNVAGYDLCKLFTGSYGSLGIITELNFKLRPRPAMERTIIAHGCHTDLITHGQRVLSSKLFPVAVELLSPALAQRLGVDSRNNEPVLLLRFAGNRKGVEFQTREVLAQLNKSNCQLMNDDESLWASIASVPLIDTQALSWRGSILPSELPKCIESLIQIYGSSFFESLWQTGVGDGRIRMIERDDNGYTERVSQAVRELGGSFVIEGAHIDFESSPLMTRIKDELDPDGVFV